MNFVKFDGYAKKQHRPLPSTMYVGQILARTAPCLRTRCTLAEDMRKAMREQGMEFSVADDGEVYAIRRDK